MLSILIYPYAGKGGTGLLYIYGGLLYREPSIYRYPYTVDSLYRGTPIYGLMIEDRLVRHPESVNVSMRDSHC